jgi:hypothetical protein
MRSLGMADRKQFLGVEPADPELLRLLEESKNVVVTDEVLREQRISFAYGNASHSSDVTKESVRQASRSMRLRA